MANREHWRVFCAIDIPANVRQRIGEHISELKKLVPDASVSWTRTDNTHLTLKFLGNIPVAAVERVSGAASRAVSEVRPFEINVTGAGSFPAHGQPRILWVGLEDSEQKLASVQKRLEEELFEEGFPKEARAFHPHLTIARIRRPQHARTLAAVHRNLGFESISIRVDELLVVRSELHPSGSQYTVISRHPLGP